MANQNLQVINPPPTLDFSTLEFQKEFWGDSSACFGKVQGGRQTQEDFCSISRHLCPLSLTNYHVGAIYDGHGGSEVAEHLVGRMPILLADSLRGKQYLKTLHQESNQTLLLQEIQRSFEALEGEIQHFPRMTHQGSTAAVAVITPSYVVLANTGDSNILIKRRRTVTNLVTRHSVNVPIERQRILEARENLLEMERTIEIRNDKLLITYYEGGRLEGGFLEMSRSFGDKNFKNFRIQGNIDQPVITTPEVNIYRRNPELDQFILIYSDGVSEMMNQYDLCDFVEERIGRLKLDTIIRELFVECHDGRGARDNLSFGIILFQGAFLGIRKIDFMRISVSDSETFKRSIEIFGGACSSKKKSKSNNRPGFGQTHDDSMEVDAEYIWLVDLYSTHQIPCTVEGGKISGVKSIVQRRILKARRTLTFETWLYK